MTSNVMTNAIMTSGMKCLVEKLGIIEAEMFVSTIRENSFDYTEWRRDNLWKGMSLEEILDLAVEREKKRSQ